jgi:hypothetical protein
MISSKQIEAIKSRVEAAQRKVAVIKEKAELVTTRAKTVAEVAAGGFAAGYLDHRLPGADSDGTVALFGFRFAPSLAAGAGLSLGAMLDVFGKNTDDALAFGSGMLAGRGYHMASKTGAAAKAKGTLFGASSPDLIGGVDFQPAVGLDSLVGRHHG